MEIKNVYELSEEELKELDLEDGDEYALFEGDPDYMLEPIESSDGLIGFNPIYFFIWKDRNLVITSDDTEYADELLEFCEGQDTRVSLGGNNTRSETNHWEFLEKNNWEGWEECKNLKIAYRGGCGYVYTLFEYIK